MSFQRNSRIAYLCDIQHSIDFVPGSTLHNLPQYRMNLTEHAELKRQVDELLSKSSLKKI